MNLQKNVQFYTTHKVDADCRIFLVGTNAVKVLYCPSIVHATCDSLEIDSTIEM